MDENSYLRSAAARQKLGGISEPTFWRLRQREDFPLARMIGRTPLWNSREIDEFLDRQPRRK